MISEFLLLFSWLNLFLLLEEKQNEVIKKTKLTILEAVRLFEYRKNNKKYEDGAKLYKQIVSKALSIAKAFYPGYSPLFLFINVIGYFVYTNNALRTRKMNKSSNGKQAWLRNGWYEKYIAWVEQLMFYQIVTSQ